MPTNGGTRVMIIDKTNKVIIGSLDKKEAIAYVKFLIAEVARHETYIRDTDATILWLRLNHHIGELEDKG